MSRRFLPLVIICGLILVSLIVVRQRRGPVEHPGASIPGSSNQSSTWGAGQVTAQPTILERRADHLDPQPPDTSWPPAPAMVGQPTAMDVQGRSQLNLPPELTPYTAPNDSSTDDQERHEVNRPSEAATEENSPAAAVSDPTAPHPEGQVEAASVDPSPPAADQGNVAPPVAGEILSPPAAASLSTGAAEAPAARTSTAPGPSLITDEPGVATGRVTTVRQGDTLVTIARRELGHGTRWVEIYRLNRGQLGTRIDALPPGTRLLLPDR